MDILELSDNSKSYNLNKRQLHNLLLSMLSSKPAEKRRYMKIIQAIFGEDENPKKWTADFFLLVLLISLSLSSVPAVAPSSYFSQCLSLSLFLYFLLLLIRLLLLLLPLFLSRSFSLYSYRAVFFSDSENVG